MAVLSWFRVGTIGGVACCDSSQHLLRHAGVHVLHQPRAGVQLGRCSRSASAQHVHAHVPGRAHSRRRRSSRSSQEKQQAGASRGRRAAAAKAVELDGGQDGDTSGDAEEQQAAGVKRKGQQGQGGAAKKSKAK